MNGEWVFRYDNGNLKGKGKYINGDGSDLGKESKIPKNGREGLWVIYHENGNKSQEVSYENGVIKGKGTTYHKNGNLWSSSNYIAGKRDGEYRSYYENGNLEWKIKFIKGSREGNAMKYNENGDSVGVVFKNDTYEYEGSVQKIYYTDGSTIESKYELGNWYREKTEHEKRWDEEKWKMSLHCMWCNKEFIAERGIATYCDRASSSSQWWLTMGVNIDDKYKKHFCSKKCAIEYCDAQ
jgi:hypothetical protein